MNKYLEKIAKIAIKPSHKGELHRDLGEPKDKKLTLSEEENMKHNGTPAEKKRATFAINARKWNKE